MALAIVGAVFVLGASIGLWCKRDRGAVVAEPSEFGAGLVVCLAKFSEHLWSPMAEQYLRMHRWTQLDADARRKLEAEAIRHPIGDAAALIADVQVGSAFGDSEEEMLSRALELWANGASDHFYDLDRDRAPEPLRELAELMLQMGHGFRSDRTWTHEDWDRVQRLWRDSCMELDRKLGTRPDWGRW